MAQVMRNMFLALCIATLVSAGISCPEGCEVCDPNLGCLSPSSSMSQIEDGSMARFLSTCPDLCTSCESGNCQTCKLNASLSSSSCVCDSNYFKTNLQCSPCSNLCLTCNPATGCTQCKPNAGDDPSDCSCVSGYRLDNNQCVQCTDPLCDTCNASGDCQKCKSNAGSDITNCQCVSGYYPSGGQCVTCSQPLCAECDSNGDCTSCISGAEGSPNCKCKSGFYQNKGTCTQCLNPLCDRCDILGCLDCKQFAGSDPSSCSCQAGYYQSNSECVACSDSLCSSCDSDGICSQCKANTDDNLNDCSCTTGYYELNRACHECPALCTSCSDGVGCLSCKENAGNDSGDCECSPGYFQNSSNECEKCTDDLCEVCSSADICTSCVEGAEITDSGCKCKKGYMMIDNYCVPCPDLCAECDLTGCTSCLPNAGTDTEHCDCDIYYFQSGNQCVHCSALCLACGSTGCKTCKEHSSLTSEGTCKCNEGYYESNGACIPCANSLCSACSADECTQCKSHAGSDPNECACEAGYYNRRGVCVECEDSLCASCTIEGCSACVSNAGGLDDCRCMKGYYEDNGECKHCSSLCAHCDPVEGCKECKPYAGIDTDNCACVEGYYLSNDFCEKCSDDLCGVCTADSCSTCTPNAQKAEDGSCQCNDKYYKLGTECVEYPALAATLDSSNAVATCVDNAENIDGVCQCISGYYHIGEECRACNISQCAECDYLGCTTCVENAEKIDGVCTCKDGYYLNNGACTQCNSLCKVCDPVLGCQQCKTNAGSDPTNCQCIDNYWLFVNQCIECSPLCETCTSSGCTACKANAGSDPSNCICESGYYQNVDQCTACTTTYDLCTECTSTGCTECTSLAQLNNGACTCLSGANNDSDPEVCVCSSTHKLNSDGTACVACPANSNQASDSVSTCKCVDGYYMNGDETECIACPGLCTTCSSGTVCSTCIASATKDSDNADSCICPNDTKVSSTGDSCLPCPENSVQNSSNSSECVCNSGYRMNAEGNCELCSVAFNLCVTCSTSECTTCAANSTRSGNGCACSTGFGLSGGNCIACSTTFSNCVNCDETTCTQCIENSTFSTNECACNEGYYLSAGNCASCPTLCNLCDSTGTCTQCTDNASVSGSGCVCNEGFVASEGACVPCSNSLCKSCTSSGCSECKENASDTTNCTCNSGYFNSNGACVACNDSLCKTCTAADTCTLCDDNASNLADCTCNSGYFESNGACTACDDTLCDICSSANTCTQCKANAGTDLTNCECISGYFESNGSCVPCDNSLCATCNPSSTCTQCKPNAGTDVTNCACASGYYSSNGSCQPCSNSLCADCDPGNTCTQCKANAGTDTSNCSCVEGYYLSNNQCTACTSLCKSCDSTGQCLECKPNAGDDPSSCTCSQGYYLSSNACVACHALCSDCTSSTCNTCTANSGQSTLNPFQCLCNDGYYKMGSECLPKDTLCASYIDDAGCQSCKENAGSDTSDCICASGYYESSGSCVSCGSLCGNCDPTLGCQSCVENAGTDPSNCQCQTGYYQSGSQCIQCGSLCKSCNSLACAECVANTNGDPTNCQCSAGYYNNNNVCSECPNLCTECTGLNTCSACAENAEIVNGVCACKTGYYDSGASTCLQCTGLCARCSDASSCLECKENAGSDASNCQCQGRYTNVSNQCVFQCPDDCETCSSSSHECFTCKQNKVYWPWLGVCYSGCPTGHTTSTTTINGNTLTQCVLSSSLIFSSEFTDLQSSKTSNGITLTGTNTSSQYKRGWYYNGSSSYATFQNKIVYAPTFYIEFWVRFDNVNTLGALFSKYHTVDNFLLFVQNSKLNLKVNSMASDASYATSEKAIEFPNLLFVDTWYKFGIAVTLNSSKRSTITLFSNGVQSFTTTLDTGYILDEITNSSTYVLGAHYKSPSSITSYFRGFIAYVRTENGAYTPTQSSGNCITSTNCLSSCGILQFPKGTTCGNCITGCTTGCANSDRCSLNIDPLCTNFNSFETCTTCAAQSSLVNGVCTCVQNATYDPTTASCKCNTDYTANTNNQCVLCKDYLTPSEVSGAYTSDYSTLILTFARTLKASSISCADLFKSDTFTKIGSRTTCTVSTDRLRITILLGADSTFTTGTLTLNELSIVGNRSTCRTDTTPIALNIVLTTPAPELSAFIELQDTYSKGCGTTTSFNVKGEKSRFVSRFGITYSWSASGSGVTAELTTFLATQTIRNIVIQPSMVSSGDVTITLVVRNTVGNSSTASKTMSVSDSRLLTVGVDAGQYLSLTYGTSFRVAGFVSNRCDSAGPFTFTWVLSSSTNTGFSATSSTFTQTNNAITLSGTTLPPGFDYTFRVTATDTQISGSNSITLTILYPPLVAKLNRVSGTISSNSDLSLSASGSSDPYGSTLSYTWKCFIQGVACTDPEGNPLTFINIDSIVIVSDKLIPDNVYSLGVTVSTADGRTATTSIDLEAIASPPNSIEITPPPKSSHQDPLIVTPNIQSSVESTFVWNLVSGPNSPTNEGSTLSPVLQFSKNVLIEGGSYVFELSILNAATSALIGKGSLSIAVNDGPKGGEFTVSPTEGVELTTRFYYTADSFYDGDEADYPLTYAYSYITESGENFKLKGTSFSNTYSSYLNSLVKEVAVVVCDSIPTCLTVSKPVTVSAAGTRMLQDTLLDRYYASIQDDEDIPGVTSIFATSKLIEPADYPDIKNTFVEYMDTLLNNQFIRALYYSVFRSFLMDDGLVSNEEVINYLLTCEEKINHNDNSVSEAQQIYDIFSSSIYAGYSDPNFVANGVELLKNIHWYTFRSQGPSVFPEDLTQETHLNIRTFGKDFLGNTLQFKDFSITYPVDDENQFEVYNLYAEIVQTDDLPLITVYTSAVGRLNELNIELYTDQTPYTVSSADQLFTLEFPYAGVATTEKKVSCTIYSPNDASWSDTDCTSEIMDGRIKVNTSSLGSLSFRIVDVIVDPPKPPTTVDDDDSECDLSPGPFVIVGLWFGMLFVSIVVVIMIKINRPDLIGNHLHTIDTGKNGRRNQAPPASPEDIELQLANSKEIEARKEETPAKIDYTIQSYLKLHVLVEPFKKNDVLYKLSHIINIFTSMYLGYALIGAIMYSQIDIDNEADDSFTDISDEHYPDDAKYIFIVLGIIIPAALPLRFLTKVNNKKVTIPTLVATLVVMVGSMLGVLLMGGYFCKAAADRWTLAYLIFIPLELTISESIIAAVLFVAGKR